MQGQLGELLSSILKVFRGHIYSEKSALCTFFFSLKTFGKDSFKLCKGGKGVHLNSCKLRWINIP